MVSFPTLKVTVVEFLLSTLLSPRIRIPYRISKNQTISPSCISNSANSAQFCKRSDIVVWAHSKYLGNVSKKQSVASAALHFEKKSAATPQSFRVQTVKQFCPGNLADCL